MARTTNRREFIHATGLAATSLIANAQPLAAARGWGLCRVVRSVELTDKSSRIAGQEVACGAGLTIGVRQQAAHLGQHRRISLGRQQKALALFGRQRQGLVKQGFDRRPVVGPLIG